MVFVLYLTEIEKETMSMCTNDNTLQLKLPVLRYLVTFLLKSQKLTPFHEFTDLDLHLILDCTITKTCL